MIDPEGVVRAIISYPLTTGRNIEEIYRLLLALQAYDQTGDPTPADWMPGEDQLYPVPATLSEAQKRSGNCLDWYICFANTANSNAAFSPQMNAPMTMPNMSSNMAPNARPDNTNVNSNSGNMPANMTMGFMPSTVNPLSNVKVDNSKPDIKTGSIPTGINMGNAPAGSTMTNIMPATMMGYMPNNIANGFMPQPNMTMGYMPAEMSVPVISNEMPNVQSYTPEMQKPAPNSSNVMPTAMTMDISASIKPMKPSNTMKGPASDAAYADVMQPGRPFCPDDTVENEMPAMKTGKQPSISEQNRNMMAPGMNQPGMGANFLGDYIVTRTPKQKK